MVFLQLSLDQAVCGECCVHWSFSPKSCYFYVILCYLERGSFGVGGHHGEAVLLKHKVTPETSKFV